MSSPVAARAAAVFALMMIAWPPTVLAAGTFDLSRIVGDADSGISPAKTYTHAVDFGGPNGVGADFGTTINGVPFTIGRTSGPNYSTSGFATLYNFGFAPRSVPAGPNTLYDLLEDFYHSSTTRNPPPQTITLTGLTPGTRYTTSFYNAGFDLAIARTRVVTVDTSDGGSFTFDQNFTGEGNPSVLRYTFTAAAPSITYTFTPATADTFHQYGFTNEVVPDPAGAAALALGAVLTLRRHARR